MRVHEFDKALLGCVAQINECRFSRKIDIFPRIGTTLYIAGATYAKRLLAPGKLTVIACGVETCVMKNLLGAKFLRNNPRGSETEVLSPKNDEVALRCIANRHTFYEESFVNPQ